MKRWISFLLLIASCVAQQPGNRDLPSEVKQQLDQAASAAAIARAGAYVLRAGDELEVRSLLIPELNQVVRVRPDGRISVVLLNEVEAAGRTAEELAKALSTQYARHFRSPEVTVIVRTFNNLNVYVGGEVQHPGLVPIGGGLTATAAVFQAGGFKEEEGPRRLVVLRQVEQGKSETLNLDVADVLLRGRPDLPLQASDVIFVPRTSINVYVGGEVVEPGLIPLNQKLTPLAAIIRAKGLKNTAKPESALLIRDSGGKPIVQKIDLKRIMAKGDDGEFTLKPYDVVFIPKSRIAKIDQAMDQYVKQLLPIGVNMGFSYLLGVPYYQ